MMFNPNLLPESADPEGSIRYKNVDIVHVQITNDYEEVTFFDMIEVANRFEICDKSPHYDGYECHVFKGDVLKEKNGGYSWWKSIKK